MTWEEFFDNINKIHGWGKYQGVTCDDNTVSCNCIGPQNGQPVCPCRMKSITIENGRYVKKEDLGPV